VADLYPSHDDVIILVRPQGSCAAPRWPTDDDIGYADAEAENELASAPVYLIGVLVIIGFFLPNFLQTNRRCNS